MLGEKTHYDLFIHRHNFSVWAGARAAQRGFLSTSLMVGAIEYANIAQYLRDPHFPNVSQERFEALHREWCSSICSYWNSFNKPNVSYGRAAKLVAIYLKSMVLNGPDALSPLGRIIHPPVDSILLENLSSDKRLLDQETRKRWKSTTWTTLDECDYYTLIAELRSVVPPELPFWTIERYWEASERAQEVEEDLYAR